MKQNGRRDLSLSYVAVFLFFAGVLIFDHSCLSCRLTVAKEKGVTYSRPLTGMGMPSKERFQTRPMGRAFKHCLLSRNFPFRE